MKTFGSIVREARHLQKKTVEQVARSIDASKANVSAFETGKAHPPRPPKVRRLARCLGLDYRRLLAFRLLDRLPDGLLLEDVMAAIAEIREDEARQARMREFLDGFPLPPAPPSPPRPAPAPAEGGSR